jgi:hypothetical protein
METERKVKEDEARIELDRAKMVQAKDLNEQKLEQNEDLAELTLTVTLTPKDLDYQTTMTLRADVGDYHHWEDPIELKPATEVTFTVADDSAVGGNFSLFTTILEGEKAQ